MVLSANFQLTAWWQNFTWPQEKTSTQFYIRYLIYAILYNLKTSTGFLHYYIFIFNNFIYSSFIYNITVYYKEHLHLPLLLQLYLNAFSSITFLPIQLNIYFIYIYLGLNYFAFIYSFSTSFVNKTFHYNNIFIYRGPYTCTKLYLLNIYSKKNYYNLIYSVLYLCIFPLKQTNIMPYCALLLVSFFGSPCTNFNYYNFIYYIFIYLLLPYTKFI